jgi:hypothetical protein
MAKELNQWKKTDLSAILLVDPSLFQIMKKKETPNSGK